MNSLTDEARLIMTQRALESAKTDPVKAALNSKLFVTSPAEDFRRRVTHSLLILCTMFYLKLNTLILRLFQCIYAPNPASVMGSDAITGIEQDGKTEMGLYLKADLQSECYQGIHFIAVIVAAVLFVVYSAGFPLATFILLCRSFADDHTGGRIGWMRRHFSILRKKDTPSEEMLAALAKMEEEQERADELAGGTQVHDSSAIGLPEGGIDHKVSSLKPGMDRHKSTVAMALSLKQKKRIALLYIEHQKIQMFGFLFLDVREEVFPYRLSALLTNFLFALVTTYVLNVQRQLFALGMVFAWDALIVSWFLPFRKWFLNLRVGIVACALIAQNGLMLGLQTRTVDGGPSKALFIVLAVVFAMLCILLAGRDRIMRAVAKCSGIRIRTSDGGTTADGDKAGKVKPYDAAGGTLAGETAAERRRNEFMDDDEDEEHSSPSSGNHSSRSSSSSHAADRHKGVPSAWSEQSLGTAAVLSGMMADDAAAEAAAAESERLEAEEIAHVG